MKVLLISLFILFFQTTHANYVFESHFEPDKKWTEFSKNQKFNLKNLFYQLVKSPIGKELVRSANEKAKLSNKTLYDIVHEGRGSLTDTTLIRKFNPQNLSEITYESNSKVFINKELNQYDALLDLAHELTHYVYRHNFNPYTANFDLADFISNTIEGAGGEVEAFIMECRIHNELFPGQNSTRYNCRKIKDPTTGKISFHHAVKRFYHVGGYFESFNSMLKQKGIAKNFPSVSAGKINFISSAYGIPYPVAAYEEYLTIMNKVCENDKRRISYFKKEPQRNIASLNTLEKKYDSSCRVMFN
ncbi:MAG: hypothetical protein HON90_16310 [Halobacteriovoraceae bacterium]|jgi:hypothetical protein|nr:hypothetical protein [Halobacteriovoraceae bacterium]